MRAKSHDQRKGQWFINKIRENNPKVMNEHYHKNIELKIWNMENDEFDRMMSDYND